MNLKFEINQKYLFCEALLQDLDLEGWTDLQNELWDKYRKGYRLLQGNINYAFINEDSDDYLNNAVEESKLLVNEGMNITKQIFPYVILGVGIGALIHGFVPASLVEKYLSSRSFWSVTFATLLGSPLYANSVSVIPVMEALVGKGVPLGTALAFMTAIVTVSIPESMILKKVMRWQLLAIFFGITLTGIMVMGYIFNTIS